MSLYDFGLLAIAAMLGLSIWIAIDHERSVRDIERRIKKLVEEHAGAREGVQMKEDKPTPNQIKAAHKALELMSSREDPFARWKYELAVIRAVLPPLFGVSGQICQEMLSECWDGIWKLTIMQNCPVETFDFFGRETRASRMEREQYWRSWGRGLHDALERLLDLQRAAQEEERRNFAQLVLEKCRAPLLLGGAQAEVDWLEDVAKGG